jgi:RNA polymerase sigma-70 factor (ECF subfamily)
VLLGLGLLLVLLPTLGVAFVLVLVLTQVIGLSYAEAAEICGCRLGTIRSRVARARDDLRGALSTSTRSSAADR